jgi:hypothetical protein
MFSTTKTNDFKGTDIVEYQIPIGDAPPIRRHQYSTPYALGEEMQTQVQDMLEKGVIRESKSPSSAPAILVPKKSPDGKPKYKFCVDFRAPNSVTKFDSYPCQRLRKPPEPCTAPSTSPFWPLTVSSGR